MPGTAVASLDRLVRLVQEHDRDAYHIDGRLMVREVLVYVDPLDVRADWIQLEPTVSAVRDWLGY